MARNDAIRTIKERLNIVDIVQRYVTLKRNGPRWVAPCPFHQETKPSFSVNEQEGVFYCFGCQASGDIFAFYMRINGLDFKEALEELALEAHVTLEAPGTSGASGAQHNKRMRETRSARQHMLRMYELATAHFAGNLQSAGGAECRAYLADRGIPSEMIQRFGLGYSLADWQPLCNALRRAGFDEAQAVEAGLLGKSTKGHDSGGGGSGGRAYDRFRGRLMFPIRNLSHQVIAFGGRSIGDTDEAKYINSPDSPIYKKGDHLYGLAQARKAITLKGSVLLTEGYMDVLTLHQFGYEHAVGVLGTAFTPVQVEQVKRLASFASRMVLLFDGDRAGRKAALKVCEMLLARGLSCSVVLMPEGEDIDSLLRSRGTEAFEALLASAPEGLQFCTDTVRALAPREAVDWARQFLKQVEVPELLSPFISRLASHLQLSEAVVRGALPKARTPEAGHRAQPTAPLRTGTMLERQILMFAVRYPHRLDDVRETGADMAISSPFGRALWAKLEMYAVQDILVQLGESEKQFWVHCRTGETAPLDDGDKELHALMRIMQAHDAQLQKHSTAAALRENAQTGDFAAEKEYLRAFSESLRRSDG